MSAPKRGEHIEPLSCDNPVARHCQIGERMGVTGTPTFVLPDGRVILGVLSPDQLAEALGLTVPADVPTASDLFRE